MREGLLAGIFLVGCSSLPASGVVQGGLPAPTASQTPQVSIAPTATPGFPSRPSLAPGTLYFSRLPHLNLVVKGQKTQLVPLEAGTGGTPLLWPQEPPMSWVSDLPAVATVDAKGVVEAVANGDTRVSVVQGTRRLALPVRVRLLTDGGHYFDETIRLGVLSGPVDWLKPIPIWIEPHATYLRPAQQALKTWEGAHERVRFLLSARELDSYITVRWVDALEAYGTAKEVVPADADAITRRSASYLGAGDVLENRREIFIRQRDRVAGRVFSQDDMQKIVTHELGHALGIAGHSPDRRDIMYAAVNPENSTALTARDRETLKWALFATPNHLPFFAWSLP